MKLNRKPLCSLIPAIKIQRFAPRRNFSGNFSHFYFFCFCKGKLRYYLKLSNKVFKPFFQITKSQFAAAGETVEEKLSKILLQKSSSIRSQKGYFINDVTTFWTIFDFTGPIFTVLSKKAYIVSSQSLCMKKYQKYVELKYYNFFEFSRVIAECQFYQHFTSSFLVQKRFSAFLYLQFVLVFFDERKCAKSCL